ncbi:MAG: hypothetical protein ACAH83_17315 [Alphaproteobacteria bacterium]
MDAETTIRTIIIGLALTVLLIAVILFRAFILFPLSVRHRGWKAGFREYPVSAPLGILLMTCVLTAVGGWFYYVRWWHLSFVPPAMSVSKVLYAREEAWGFGPGGNECGVIVFELPEEAVDNIHSLGMSYFSGLPVKQPSRGIDHRNGIYESWHRTPMVLDGRFPNGEGMERLGAASSVPRIRNYLGRYGDNFDIASVVEDEIDKAISTSGSFYSYSVSGGILIVIPDANHVVYVYSG